jgi:hypothetical protein
LERLSVNSGTTYDLYKTHANGWTPDRFATAVRRLTTTTTTTSSSSTTTTTRDEHIVEVSDAIDEQSSALVHAAAQLDRRLAAIDIDDVAARGLLSRRRAAVEHEV